MSKKQLAKAKRKNLFSLKLYLMTKARRKAEKLQWRQEKREMKQGKGKHQHEHNHDHNHDHDHEHEHEQSETK